MNELARAAWILFQVHLVRTFRSRRGLIAALLAAGPVALAFVVRTVSSFEGAAPNEVVITLVWMVIQPIVPLVALVLASGVIADEIEDRTVTYLFTRPIPRAAILLGRWLAAALPIMLLCAISGELVVALLSDIGNAESRASWLPEGFHARMLGAVLLGGATYSALFAAAGALFKRPMLVGIAYTFVYEGFLGNLPGANQKGTVVFYLRSILFHGQDSLMGEMQEAIFSVPLVGPFAATRSLLLILVGVLALGSWRFARREYVLAA